MVILAFGSWMIANETNSPMVVVKFSDIGKQSRIVLVMMPCVMLVKVIFRNSIELLENGHESSLSVGLEWTLLWWKQLLYSGNRLRYNILRTFPFIGASNDAATTIPDISYNVWRCITLCGRRHACSSAQDQCKSFKSSWSVPSSWFPQGLDVFLL